MTRHGSVPLQRSLLVVAAALLAAACDDFAIVSPEPWPEGFVIDGFWAGTIDDGRFEMTLVHHPDGQLVTGAGAWIPPTGSRAFRVDGVVREEEGFVTLLLELSASTPEGPPAVLVHYRARPRGHPELRGHLNGGGFDDELLVLRRTVAP